MRGRFGRPRARAVLARQNHTTFFVYHGNADEEFHPGVGRWESSGEGGAPLELRPAEVGSGDVKRSGSQRGNPDGRWSRSRNPRVAREKRAERATAHPERSESPDRGVGNPRGGRGYRGGGADTPREAWTRPPQRRCEGVAREGTNSKGNKRHDPDGERASIARATPPAERGGGERRARKWWRSHTKKPGFSRQPLSP